MSDAEGSRSRPHLHPPERNPLRGLGGRRTSPSRPRAGALFRGAQAKKSSMVDPGVRRAPPSQPSRFDRRRIQGGLAIVD